MIRHLLLFSHRKGSSRFNARTYLSGTRTSLAQTLQNYYKGIIRHKQNHQLQTNTSKDGCKSNSRIGCLAFATLSAMSMSPNSNTHGNPFMMTSQLSGQSNPFSPHISWHDFCYDLLARGEVESVTVKPEIREVFVNLHHGAMVNGKPLPLRTYRLKVPSVEGFEEKLREFESSLGIKPGHGVTIVYDRVGPMPALIATAMFIGIAYFFFKRVGSEVNRSSFMSSFTKLKYTLVDPATRNAESAIKFKDVAGLQEAKVEITEFVDYLKNSERFIKLGAKLPKGVLLTGPPGCGKTLLAKAVANEADVPFLALSGSDFSDMIGGVGASRVRDLFKKGRKLAPCIIYIDEIDSIGKQRAAESSSFGHRDDEQTLNQLLVEMDGMTSQKGIILLASTNRAEVLDKALLRPGRFDRQILIDLPTLAERREIFEKHASKIKMAESPIDLSLRIAQLTPRMSGADLANVCNEAALHAAKKDQKFVLAKDFEYAIEKVVAGTERRSNCISAHEKRVIAYHECGHALMSWLLIHTEPVLKVSIVPRSRGILGFAQYIDSDRKLRSPEELFDLMCLALGGRVAELITFNHLSTGAQDDLRRVTEMAMSQIKEFGFDPVIGHISFPKEEQDGFSQKPYSELLASMIDHRASILVKDAFERTRALMSEHSDKLGIMASELLEKEVMNTDDIQRLIGPRPHQRK